MRRHETRRALARPPRVATWLLRRRRRLAWREEIETDLRELFDHRVRTRGIAYAAFRYWIDVLSLWRLTPLAVAMTEPPHRRKELCMREDITFALRMFRRQPGIMLMTLAGLALAIGISTAMFSLVNAVVWRGNGIREPESVFRVSLRDMNIGRLAEGNSPMVGNWSSADFEALRRTATTMDVAAGFSFQEGREFRASADPGTSVQVSVMPASGSYFPVLGGEAALGRTLTRSDDEAGAPKLAVLNHTFWTTTLSADPGIVGTTVWVDETPFTVVGIASRGFIGAVEARPPAMWTTFSAWADVWSSQQAAWKKATQAEVHSLEQLPTPTTLQRDRLAALRSELDTAMDRWNRPVDVLGRLRSGVTPERAASEVTAIARGLAAERMGAGHTPTVRLEVIDTPAQRLRGEPTLMVAVGVILVLIVLLVALACGNIANVLLANAAGRRREIGTRLALGASRARIVRQLLTESLLLGLVGGSSGLVLSIWITPVLAQLLQVPSLLEIHPDLTVYGFVAGISITAGVLAGLAPARYGRRGDVLAALRADQHDPGPVAAPRRLRSLLIGAQSAASIVLLVLAALLTRSLVQATTLDFGFNPDRLMSLSVGFSGGYDSTRVMTYWDAALDRVARVPGVSGAALASIPPFAGFSSPQRLLPSRFGSVTSAQRNEVSENYFDTLGIRILKGRTFTGEEVRTGAAVAVISASLASDYWGDADPIGSTLDEVWGPPDVRPTALRKPPGTRVVGVVSESVARLRGYGAPTIYLPFNREFARAARMVVATQDDARMGARTVVAALTALDPNRQPQMRLVRDGLARELEMPRALSVGALVLGASALGLAMIGLFGVTAFLVGQRRHEISVRMALGAHAGDVVRMFVRQSLRPVLIGAACGLLVAFGAGQLVAGVLVGVSGHDPIAIVGAVAVLIGAAAVAAFVPARRAARVSPAEILREQ